MSEALICALSQLVFGLILHAIAPRLVSSVDYVIGISIGIVLWEFLRSKPKRAAKHDDV